MAINHLLSNSGQSKRMASGDPNELIEPSHNPQVAGAAGDRPRAEQSCPVDKRHIWRSRLVEARRYVSVGAVCAALHNIIVITAARMGLHYMLAVLLSFSVVTPTGYALHSLYTFNTRFSWHRFARFASGIIGGIPLAIAIMFILCSLLHVAVFIATPIATIAQFAWNYLSTRWAVLLVPKANG